MDDLISRQAAIDALHDEIVRRRIDEDTNDDGALDEFDTEEILRQLPSAQPEIVRCKNCKNFRRNIPCVGGVYDGCGELLDEGNEMPVEESFYCGYAERQEE